MDRPPDYVVAQDRIPAQGEEAINPAVWVQFVETANLDPSAVARLNRELSEDERRKAAAFAFDRDRATYVAAHAMLRQALRPLLGGAEPNFTLSRYGRPELAREHASDLSFNLTHTGEFAACAVMRGLPVGIDAEDIRRPLDIASVAARWFAPEEQRLLQKADADRAGDLFFRIWTIKEAILKAAGCGLQVSPERFAVIPGQDSATLTPGLGIATEWRLAEFSPLPHIRIAIAVPGRRPIRVDATAVDLA
jgi:4'-phosphopantetheinyl transferase